MYLIIRVLTIIVVPVSTKSTTASARPKPHAASTDPETYFMPSDQDGHSSNGDVSNSAVIRDQNNFYNGLGHLK